MDRPTATVGDIVRRYGEADRLAAERGLSTAQRRVLTAIAACRTAALGGHVEQCDGCGHTRVWYNRCRNRHYYVRSLGPAFGLPPFRIDLDNLP